LLNSVDAYFRRQPLRDECCNSSLTVVSETLEHYECTVILTSSRVDIFDQGFKSHIDLAVKYRKPDIINGREIWEKFITHLEGVDDEGSDIQGL